MSIDQPTISRRSLIESTLAAGGAFTVASLLDSRPARAAEGEGLKKNGVVLFQGDSITDCRRDRNNKNANHPAAMGYGYPYLIGAYLLATRPNLSLSVYNRGISGHKVPDLAKRWDEDCIKLKPDVLSILIGVNDIWHKLNGRYDGTVESYEKGFAALLDRTRKALPETKLIVCEPFVLKTGAVKDNWFPEFDQRRAAAKRVAEKAGAMWVAWQTMFDEATKFAKPAYWAGDGVHPTMAGHALMAKSWIETVGV